MIANVSKRELQQIFDRLPQEEKGHASRTAIYMRTMADKLGLVPELLEESRLPDSTSLSAYAMDYGLYHDIGKATGVASPSSHTQAAPALLEPLIERAKMRELSYFYGISVVAQYHHERWDGTGFPFCLAGTAIPLLGRLCAAANRYDHVSSKMRRPSHKRVMDALWEASGGELDPRVVEILSHCGGELRPLLQAL